VPVTVVEVQHHTTVSNGPRTVTFASTPAAGDVVVVLYRCHKATSVRTVSSVSGMGATWALGSNLANLGQTSVWLGTGATTAGTVTITQNSADVMSVSAYLVRGLTAPVNVVSQVSYVNANDGTPKTTSSIAALGQIVFSVMMGWDTTLNAFTFDGTTPASGWVEQTEVNTGQYGIGAMYRIPTGAGVAHETVLDSGGVGDTINATSFTLGTAAPLPVDGVITASAPVPSVSLAASLTVPGALAAGPPAPVVALTASPGTDGEVTASAPMPSVSLTAELSITGVISAGPPIPVVAIVAPGPAVGPREYLERVLTAAIPPGDGIDLVRYARDVDPPARPTLLLRIDDVVRHPDAPQSQRRYGFTLILLGAGDGEAAEADLEEALETVLWAVEDSPELPQWVRAERAVWRDTTPAFEIAVPVDFLTTNPDTAE
jgi:hypothetical protein